MNRPRHWFAGWITRVLVPFAVLGLAGCDNGKEALGLARQAEANGDFDQAIAHYQNVCSEHPKDEPCRTARAEIGPTQLRGARVAFGHGQFSRAQRLAEAVMSAESTQLREEARDLQRAKDMELGLKWEGALANRRAALPLAEELESHGSFPAIQTWLNQNRPALLQEDVQKACIPDPTRDACGSAAHRLLAKHPDIANAKDIQRYANAYDQVPLNAARVLDAQGNIREAAAEYDRTCERNTTSKFCRQARARSDELRFTWAQRAMAGGKYSAAKEALELVIEHGSPDAKTKAHSELAKPEFARGLQVEALLARNDIRSVLNDLTELAKVQDPPGLSAAEALARGRPALALADAQKECEKTSSDACGRAAQALVEAYPFTREAVVARQLLATFQRIPFDAARELEAKGDLEAAARSYGEVCDRGPSTPLCAQSRVTASALRLRAAAAARASGSYLEAKRLLESISTTGDPNARVQALQKLNSADFLVSVAAEEHRARLADVRTKCQELAPDCVAAAGQLLTQVADPVEASELRALLAAYHGERTRLDPLLDKAQRLLGECRNLQLQRAALTGCFPSPFEAGRKQGSKALVSPVEELALATAYAFGARGTPTRLMTWFGVVCWGSGLGAAIAGFLAHARGKRAWLGVVHGLVIVLALAGTLWLRGGYGRLHEAAAQVGIHLRSLAP